MCDRGASSSSTSTSNPSNFTLANDDNVELVRLFDSISENESEL